MRVYAAAASLVNFGSDSVFFLGMQIGIGIGMSAD